MRQHYRHDKAGFGEGRATPADIKRVTNRNGNGVGLGECSGSTTGGDIACNPDNRVSRLGMSCTPQPTTGLGFKHKITTENLRGKQSFAPHAFRWRASR